MSQLDTNTTNLQSILSTVSSLPDPVIVDSELSDTSTNAIQNKIVTAALNEKATKTEVQTAVANLVNSAPETLDTLGEVATALQENEEVVEALNAAIGNKVDKEEGKGLSTNDYTTEEKDKVAGIATNLVNGSETGSLRGIRAKVEDDSYTMGYNAFAIGLEAQASGSGSFSIGYQAIASGDYSFAEGYQSQASGDNSQAKGFRTIASGHYSFAEGENTEANGDASHAEGYYSQANSTCSHAENSRTVASGLASHAEGGASIALGEYSHAEGYQTEANGNKSHAGGQGTIANTMAENVIGTYNIIGNEISYFEDVYSNTMYSSSVSSTIYLLSSTPTFIAENGYYVTEISPTRSQLSMLSVGEMYTMTQDTTFSNYYVLKTLPVFDSTTNRYEYTVDRYKIDSSLYNKGSYAHIVGNGTSNSSRSNAHTLDWSGNAWFSGDVYTGSTSGTNKDEGSKKLATEDFVNTKITYGTTDLTAGTSELATGTVYLVYE